MYLFMVVEGKSHEGSEQLFIFHRGPRVCESLTFVVLYLQIQYPPPLPSLGWLIRNYVLRYARCC